MLVIPAIARNGVLMALVAVGLCRGADWPRWRGPEATGHVPDGVAVPKTLPAEAQIIWRVSIGDGHGSPVVAGGKVFYLDHQKGKEVVHAAEAATGRPLWSVPLDNVFQDAHSITLFQFLDDDLDDGKGHLAQRFKRLVVMNSFPQVDLCNGAQTELLEPGHRGRRRRRCNEQ